MNEITKWLQQVEHVASEVYLEAADELGDSAWLRVILIGQQNISAARLIV